MVLLHALKVECLPSDIPEAIEVDVSGLEEIDDAVRVHDVHVADNVTILNGPDEMIVKVQAHRVVEEEEPVAEGEEGAEGAAAEGEEGAEGAADGPTEAPEES